MCRRQRANGTAIANRHRTGSRTAQCRKRGNKMKARATLRTLGVTTCVEAFGDRPPVNSAHVCHKAKSR
jgi:hypothetical protein